MRIRTLALCLAISTATAFAQHDSAAWYHPLHVGNEWIYKTTYSQTDFPNPPVTSVDFFHRSVERDTVIDNAVWAIIRYAYIKAGESGTTRERYDTLSSRFFIGSDFIDSVRCILPSVQFGSPMSVTVQSVYVDTIVSMPTVSRHLKMWVTGAQREWIFSHGLGMTSEIFGDGDIFSGSGSASNLAYAKINGIDYGTKNILMADSLSRYHPLQIGNKWIYKVTSYNFPSAPSISYSVREIIGDTIIQNVLYKKIIGSGGSAASIERFDDITGNYIHHSGIGSVVEDSTAAHIANTYFGLYESRKLNSVYTDSVLGASRLHREIVIANQIAENEMGWVYAYGLGCVKYSIKELDPSPYGIMDEDLVYAKINGIEYGTEPVTVNDESNVIPKYFALHQNYPNPFNPSTTITFSIPSNMDISLKVYTVIGMETTSIAGGKYPAGIHSVQWRPDGLASGVYFYTLRAGKFSQTKKLILLK